MPAEIASSERKMMRYFRLCYRLAAIGLVLLLTTASVDAQVGPGNDGAGTGNPGSTTDGFGGSTTDGFGSGVTGENDGAFIGGPNTDGFIGGAITTDTNNNRQFRSITNQNVATGGNRQTGTPRIKRSRLRIAFYAPQPSFLTSLRQRNATTFQRMTTLRPTLNSVRLQLDTRGIATLTGAAPDAAARRLAANLLRLEPGVRRVKNEITIVSP